MAIPRQKEPENQRLALVGLGHYVVYVFVEFQFSVNCDAQVVH